MNAVSKSSHEDKIYVCVRERKSMCTIMPVSSVYVCTNPSNIWIYCIKYGSMCAHTAVCLMHIYVSGFVPASP